MATAMVPKIYDPQLADENLVVRTEDAYKMVKRLAREEGMLVGMSSGAALCACLEVARRLPRSERAVIVTVFPDSGEKYLSERFGSEDVERRPMPMQIRQERFRARIRAHGAETYPYECCGALLGRTARGREVLALVR